MQLFEELKRRNVIRVAAAYIVGMWLLIQVATTIEEPLGLPDWFDTFTIIGLAIGFPLALLFSWVFELTPQGLKTTEEVDRDDSITASTGRRIDRAIIVVLVVALGYFAWDKFSGPGADATETAAGPTPSLAVLPFANMSGVAENVYFSDGITEEILNSIVKLNVMDVIGRTSSFQFKGQNLDLREIGETLGVTHILEGSVRRAGDQVRITAQLIEADTGFHLWSDTYDRGLSDILSVQTEVATAIANELRLTFDAPVQAAATIRDSEAYDLYLRSREALIEHTFPSVNNAIRWLDRATTLDPELDILYVLKAEAYLDAGRIGIMPAEDAVEQAFSLLNQAAGTDSERSAQFYRVRSIAHRRGGDLDRSYEDIERAWEMNPRDPLIAESYAGTLLQSREGALRAVEILESAATWDPLNYWLPFHIGDIYRRLNQPERAEEYYRKSFTIAPDSPTPNGFYALYLINGGRIAEGLPRLIDSFRMDPGDPEGYTFPATAYLSLGDFEAVREYAGRALDILPGSGQAHFLIAAADYLDKGEDLDDPAAHRRELRERLDAILTDPETLVRRIGNGLPVLTALTYLDDGDAESAVAAFELYVADLETLLAQTPAKNDIGSMGRSAWTTLAEYAQLLKLAGREQEADVLAEKLAWIDEQAVIDMFGGALNPTALAFLVRTRAGFVDEELVFGWMRELHRQGAFYDWRAQLVLSPGQRLLKDRETYNRIIARFETSMLAAREELDGVMSATD